MNTITESADHSIANPRRTTLVGGGAAEEPTPRASTGEDHGLQMLGDDAGVCADGTCALPE